MYLGRTKLVLVLASSILCHCGGSSSSNDVIGWQVDLTDIEIENGSGNARVRIHSTHKFLITGVRIENVRYRNSAEQLVLLDAHSTEALAATLGQPDDDKNFPVAIEGDRTEQSFQIFIWPHIPTWNTIDSDETSGSFEFDLNEQIGITAALVLECVDEEFSTTFELDRDFSFTLRHQP